MERPHTAFSIQRLERGSYSGTKFGHLTIATDMRNIVFALKTKVDLLTKYRPAKFGCGAFYIVGWLIIPRTKRELMFRPAEL